MYWTRINNDFLEFCFHSKISLERLDYTDFIWPTAHKLLIDTNRSLASAFLIEMLALDVHILHYQLLFSHLERCVLNWVVSSTGAAL